MNQTLWSRVGEPYLAPTDVAALVGITSTLGLATVGAIAAILGTAAAAGGPLAIAAAVVVSLGWGGAGSVATMRGIWRRMARRWATRADALGKQLVVVAQRAIDEARNP